MEESDIEKELLAEIQVYRDKQKRWEASDKARKYKKFAMVLVYWSLFVYFVAIFVWFFFPSIQPSFHAELCASYIGVTVLAILSACYEKRTVSLEKRTIENSNFENYKVENDEKAQGLLDQLKQNHEMYQQKLRKEHEMCNTIFVNLVTTLVNTINAGFIVYKVLENTIVPIVFYHFWGIWMLASPHVRAKLDDPNQNFADWDFYRAMWRRELTWEEFCKKMGEPIWPERKKPEKLC